MRPNLPRISYMLSSSMEIPIKTSNGVRDEKDYRLKLIRLEALPCALELPSVKSIHVAEVLRPGPTWAFLCVMNYHEHCEHGKDAEVLLNNNKNFPQNPIEVDCYRYHDHNQPYNYYQELFVYDYGWWRINKLRLVYDEKIPPYRPVDGSQEAYMNYVFESAL